MSLTELWIQLQALPRADKLLAIQLLAADLAREEKTALLQPDADYPIWSPYDATDAAARMMQLLESEMASS